LGLVNIAVGHVSGGVRGGVSDCEPGYGDDGNEEGAKAVTFGSSVGEEELD